MESNAMGASDRTVAMYKGLKVAVYSVNKTEISLTRQDLIELINVCSLSFAYYYYYSPAANRLGH